MIIQQDHSLRDKNIPLHYRFVDVPPFLLLLYNLVFIVMRLNEDISRLKSLMGIDESAYMKRRVPMNELSHAFQDALNYATIQLHSKKSRGESTPLSNFANSVISMTIDDIHPYLISNREEFPYNEVYQYLVDTFKDQIILTYEMNI